MTKKNSNVNEPPLVEMKKSPENRQPPAVFSAALQVGIVVLIAAGSVSLLLLALGYSPLVVGTTMARGALSNWLKFSHVLSVWIPLLLCSCGLLFTFRAGLWNIGVEGQVIAGAIGATFILRQHSSALAPELFLGLAFLCSFIAGGVWAGIAAWLKNRGGVNEIFGGLGLNFVAQGLVLWLILTPWKRAGIASMSGTDLFDRELWLSAPSGWRVAPAALILATIVYTCTVVLLKNTRLGLKITATGINPHAAPLFGVKPAVTGFIAMLLGGGLAGLAGAVQVSGVYHRLLPSISSGYGYLALLIVMLSGYRNAPVPLICLFFAFLAAGSIQLPIVLQIDSSLSGVIQGACVIAALFVHGLYQKRNIVT